MIFLDGGERGPVTFPAFKAGDAVLRGPSGGFDFHTLPPSKRFILLIYFLAFSELSPICRYDFLDRSAFATA
jgi:hypothetical protein